MSRTIYRLKKDRINNIYTLNKTKHFDGIELHCKRVTESFNFAYDMTFGADGEHRSKRSGGNLNRTLGDIFINTFQGKMAEFAIYDYLRNENIELDSPDLSKNKLGIWDSGDLNVNNKKLGIKSTKNFGQLLLLETKDWEVKNNKGKYVHDKEGVYDSIIFVRIGVKAKTDSVKEKYNIRKNYLYSSIDDVVCTLKTDEEFRKVFKKKLEEDKSFKDVLKDFSRDEIQYVCSKLHCLLNDFNFDYDIPGYITNEDLVKIITDKYILPKNSIYKASTKSNGTKMDAENYYTQASNLIPITELVSELEKCNDNEDN